MQQAALGAKAHDTASRGGSSTFPFAVSCIFQLSVPSYLVDREPALIDIAFTAFSALPPKFFTAFLMPRF